MKKSPLLAAIFISSIVLAWGATHSEGTDVVQQSGKRVVGYLDDSLLPKRWAILRDDAHPEAPRTLVPAGSSSAAVKSHGGIRMPVAGRQNVVHAGDQLILLDDSATLHLQLAAVAIENAMEGETLRVRLVQGGAILSGVVLSPHRVKLLTFAGRFGKTQGSVR